MSHFGIIGGTNLFHSRLFRDSSRDSIQTDHGKIEFLRDEKSDVLMIPRHGLGEKCPPHRVNHLGNVAALKALGVTRVLGITSVGSLTLDIPPGTIMIPEDYIQLTGIPTFFHDHAKHITPTLCQSMRELILRIGVKYDFPLYDGGIYLQTTGPRFETRAEIRLFGTFADVVGMNMASEATLAREVEIEYANISVVDNYGNGLAGEISYEEFLEGVHRNQEALDGFLELIISEFQKAYK